MRLAVLQFLAGFFGAVSSMFLLGSLGSDYWLLAFESCDHAAFFRVTEVRIGHVCHVLKRFVHVFHEILTAQLSDL